MRTYLLYPTRLGGLTPRAVNGLWMANKTAKRGSITAGHIEVRDENRQVVAVWSCGIKLSGKGGK
jgi:hypothetical protein